MVGASRAVRVASTISYVWGVLLFVSAVAIGVPMALGGVPFSWPGFLFTFVMIGASVGFVVFGRKVRSGARAAAVPLIALNIASAFLTMYFQFPIAPVGALLGLIVVATLLTNWDDLT